MKIILQTLGHKNQNWNTYGKLPTKSPTLSARIKKALKDQGYTPPTKYQKFYRSSVKRDPKERNKYQILFDEQLKAAKIRDLFTPEYKFHPTRRWRIDWAIVPLKIAVELNGGIFSKPVKCNHCGASVTRMLSDGTVVTVREGGRHNRGSGYIKDLEKSNALAAGGWLLLQFVPGEIVNGDGLKQIRSLLKFMGRPPLTSGF